MDFWEAYAAEKEAEYLKIVHEAMSAHPHFGRQVIENPGFPIGGQDHQRQQQQVQSHFSVT
jgi:hypothetical protein